MSHVIVHRGTAWPSAGLMLDDVDAAIARVADDVRRAEGRAARLTSLVEVADTPTVRAQLGDAAVGKPLSDQLVFEVPVQNSDIPQEVLDYAAERRVAIRDVDGKVYSAEGGLP